MTLKAGDASGRLADSDTVEAVQYAADNGAKIISASYGGSGSSDTARSSISYANGKGVLFVAAAGNDGLDNDSTPHYPSSYDLPNVVSVAASDPSDLLASFSNYGKTSVDLAAPGVGILSTVLNGNYEEKQGTSMATPHVAGAAALLLSAKPGLTHLQLKQTLLDTVDPVASLAAKTVSGGRLNVKRMIALLDTDGDGMPDEWETANAAAGLNPLNPNDADLDPDADHLTSREEYENGCDPGDADTDGDSLLDGWEVTYGFNPNSPSGGLPSSSRLGGFNTSGSAENIVVSGNYAYVADGADGLVILNIANPENPVMVGAYDHPEVGIANDIAVSNGYAYVADGANGLVIINVTNPAAPTLAGWTNTVGTAEGVAVQGNYAYLADGANELIIFDVLNPALPLIKSDMNAGERAMHDIFVQGQSVYVAMDTDVKRYKVINPASSSAPLADAAAPGGFSSWTLSGIHGNGSVIASVAGVNGVQIMNTNLTILGSYNTDGTASGVFVDGNNLYVADGTNGLVVLNISSPTNPVQTARIVTESEAVGVFVSGGYAYVAEGTGGIEIFSVLPDSDGDGLLDSWELEQFSNLSHDGSGDFDNDGILDRGEYLAGLNPKNADQDGDGLTDGTQEVIVYNTDPRSVDTDGDRLADGYDGFVSTNVYTAGIDVDLDGFVDGELDAGTETSPTLADTDGDGMNDGWEHRYGLNPNVPGGSGDGDGDDLTDIEESQNNTNPSNRDTDGDGMWDGWEVHNGLNPLVDDHLLDPDSDGLTNFQEFGLGTNPKNRDSDSDSMPDGWEYTYRPTLNPTNSVDGLLDSDIDGLNNLAEYQNGTDPTSIDSDGDGMPDGWEVSNGLLASAGAGATGSNGAGGDPDGDKLLNLQEYTLISSNLWLTVYTSVTGAPASFWFSTNGVPGSTNPRNADSDGDGLTDYYEITTNATGNLYITNPKDADTDDDGFSDSWEIGHINPPGPATFNPTFKENPVTTDRDGDGLFDAEEIVLGTQPYNSNDPVFVDDDGTGDPWPLDPQSSDPAENGTKDHPFDAIQEAVNVASNGMTILISDGIYWGTGNYNINPQGKAITIKSWSNDRALVTVNSLGYGPVFVMNSGETTNTVLKGLGIKVTLSACSDGDCDHEHGIALGNASPRIENCMIFDSELDGIHCETNSNPVVIGCIISNVLNGIWCESGSSPRIQNCTIADVGHGFAGDVGIGIYADSSSGIYITNSVVSNCNGRGIVLKNSANAIIVDTDLFNCSGGITLDNSSPRIERCILQNNQAPNYYVNSNNIAVVATQLFPDDLEREKDTTKEDENGGAILMMRGSSPFIVNCLAVNNRTWAEDPNYSKLKLTPDFGLGGGFYVGDGCSPTGVNCTVADNHANTLGGGLSSHQSPFLRNMIFWGNTSSNATVVGGKRFTSINSL
jgi:parallel beta-helix repeat protein